MTSAIPPTPDPSSTPDDASFGPPPRDELDGLLRQWHAANAQKAAAGRDRLLAALAQEPDASAESVAGRIDPAAAAKAPHRSFSVTLRRIVVNRYSPLAAAAIVLAALLPFMLPTTKTGPMGTAQAKLPANIVMAPDGGRLDAFDKQGNLLGPCALKHTDVQAEISGRFTRVTVKQEYHNTLAEKIEAVYTFPLSERSGVDRMRMTIGDRVIEGEVKEREQARRIYEQAREAGRIASLLEQERPNIFTQSVANIEPGATITVEISYVELVAEHDGEFSFAFPTVVGPRYIPGSDYRRERLVPLPAGAQAREGIILAAPGTIANATIRDAVPGQRTDDELRRMITGATPIAAPAGGDVLPAVWYDMAVKYPDGSGEPAVLLADGRGNVGGRWFWTPTSVPPAGEPFANPTDQVPDADRITPTPTVPGTRAGHDISIAVTLDTGGPAITSLEAPLHKVVRTDLARTEAGQPRRVSIALADRDAIPNKDFVLKWKQSRESISSRVFTNTGPNGNFFAVQFDPPANVSEKQAVPRELVFVVDTSGSMNGTPIGLCRDVMQKAIAGMRPRDTFNIITFAGATNVLWDRPRPNTPANREEADRFISTWQGSGGTEMMSAINAALRQSPAAATGAITPAQLADLPADGRQVAVEADDNQFRNEGLSKDAVTDRAELVVREGLSIKCSPFQLPEAYLKRANQTVQDDSIKLSLLLRGAWTTRNGERVFDVSSAVMSGDSSVRPLRLVMFLTDAYVGNDLAIIDAIQKNRDTTRVFPFGIGNSVNRFLIEQMAAAGGGEPDFIFANEASEQQAQEAVDRFNRRTRMPLLTDIRVTFNGVHPLDVLPNPASVQDLWDNRPLTFLGRYAAPGNGSMTVKAQSATGPWEQTIPLSFPEQQKENSSLPTLWARAKIDGLMSQDLLGAQRRQPDPAIRAQIVQLGESFNVMSQYTSFVAVDKLRVTIAGKPRLVHVPVELPDATNWKGFFGELPQAGQGEGRAEDLRLKPEVLGQLLERSKGSTPVRGELEGLDGTTMNFAVSPTDTPAAVSPPPPGAAPSGGGTGGAVAGLPGIAAPPASPAPVALGTESLKKATEAKQVQTYYSTSGWGAPAQTGASSMDTGVQFRAAPLAARRSEVGKGGLLGRDMGAAMKARVDAGEKGLGNFAFELAGVDEFAVGATGTRATVLALAAAQLAGEGRLDDARKLVCDAPGLAVTDPTLAQSIQTLCGTLGPDAKDEQARSAAIERVRTEASADLLAAHRRATLARKLAPDVLALVEAKPTDKDTSGVAADEQNGPARGAPRPDGSIEVKHAQDSTLAVVILVSDTSDATIEALKKLGAKIDAVKPEASVVVAHVPLAKMEELALLEAVKRVELAPLE